MICIFPGRGLFGSPKPQKAPVAPLIPTPEEEIGKAEDARKKVRERSQKRRGRAASIITGAGGVQNGLGDVRRPGATSDNDRVLG